MRRYFLLAGALVLMLSLIAACGGDNDAADEDADIVDDITATVPDVSEEPTEGDDRDMTATMDDAGVTGTEDSAGADMTGTETDGAAGTMDADATGTEEDDDADDGTETDDDATGTEDDDMAEGTETEDDDMAGATGTEEDDDGTATEDDDATSTEDDDMAEGTAGEGEGGFGEPVTVGGFTFTVTDVMVLDSGGVVAPDEGNQFLGVEMTIENTGDDPIGFTSALSQVRLVDQDGEEYEIDLTATAVAIFSGSFDPTTRIEPGDEITGVAGFQVPEDLSPEDLTLVIETGDGEMAEIPLDGDDDTE